METEDDVDLRWPYVMLEHSEDVKITLIGFVVVVGGVSPHYDLVRSPEFPRDTIEDGFRCRHKKVSPW